MNFRSSSQVLSTGSAVEGTIAIAITEKPITMVVFTKCLEPEFGERSREESNKSDFNRAESRGILMLGNRWKDLFPKVFTFCLLAVL
jgi:hypothetical protein